MIQTVKQWKKVVAVGGVVSLCLMARSQLQGKPYLASTLSCLSATQCQAEQLNQSLTPNWFQAKGLTTRAEYVDVYVLDVYDQQLRVETVSAQVKGELEKVPVLSLFIQTQGDEDLFPLAEDVKISTEEAQLLQQGDVYRYQILTQAEAETFLLTRYTVIGQALHHQYQVEFESVAEALILELSEYVYHETSEKPWNQLQLETKLSLQALANTYQLSEEQVKGKLLNTAATYLRDWEWFYGTEWAIEQADLMAQLLRQG